MNQVLPFPHVARNLDLTFKNLCGCDDQTLEMVFRAGVQPKLNDLRGYEFCGFNTPRFIALFGIQKFKKGFFGSPEKLEGYNIPVFQNGLQGNWLCQPSQEQPKRFGFYNVYPVKPNETDNRYPNAVLLNYGESRRNPLYEPARVLRDYVVQPDPSNPDLYLGKAYIALGPLRIPSNFFVLKRDRSSDFTGC